MRRDVQSVAFAGAVWDAGIGGQRRRGEREVVKVAGALWKRVRLSFDPRTFASLADIFSATQLPPRPVDPLHR